MLHIISKKPRVKINSGNKVAVYASLYLKSIIGSLEYPTYDEDLYLEKYINVYKNIGFLM